MTGENLAASGISGIYTIPPGADFLAALASGLAKSVPPKRLGQTKIFLPTRRACRALTEAFLEGNEAAGLLPAAYPLGDVDVDDLAFQSDIHASAAAEAAIDLPPALAATRRTLLLAQLAQAKERSEHGAEMPLPAALRLGLELGRFLDDLAIDRVPPDAINRIDVGAYAAHWQRVKTFLEIVLEQWPVMLAELDRMDPTARREALIDAQAAAWTHEPPTAPTIIAGSTGAQLGTRSLMQALLSGSAGAVVLPGFDNGVSEAGFKHILNSPGHPQHAMATALQALGLKPGDVQIWPGADVASSPRAGLAMEALRPAAEAGEWRNIQPGQFSRSIQNLQRADASSQDQEARIAALYLREQLQILSLEKPYPKLALVTPDRGLARRVRAELRRWDIEADDSAGEPLGQTPLGAFLRLVARACRPSAATVDILALLKHPLTAGGDDRAAFRANARALERAVWRDDRRQRQARTLADAAALLLAQDHPELAAFAAAAGTLSAPLTQALQDGDVLRPILEAHIRTAEAFATSQETSGAEALWLGDAGEAAAALIAEILDAADASPPLDGQDYPESFDALIENASVRNNQTAGAPVQIMGVLEARLAGFDAVVLGGMDEGVWPRPPAADPWFSRAMRREIGLTDPEKRLGLSAHDFAQLLHCPNVLLTRSQLRDDAPTKPSRWLVRLDAVLAADGATLPLATGQDYYRFLAAALDPALDAPGAEPPNFAPPLAARPRRLSATEIETLILDPYAIYAKRVLGLYPLGALDPPPSPADRGRIVHAAFEAFLKAHSETLPDDVLAAILEAGDQAFVEFADHAEAQAFWRPAFERSARWAAEREIAHRRSIALAKAHAELTGEAVFNAPGGPFKLTARADRIDIGEDGALAIIDYKTGTPPGKAAIASAETPQLPLEAAIARHGAFTDGDGKTLAGLATDILAIWQLAGRDGGKITAIEGESAATALDLAWNGVQRLIAGFDYPDTPYLSEPRTAFGEAPRFSEYRALARLSNDVEEP
jgi:ATP-dependent helicase/nuclease subunit B